MPGTETLKKYHHIVETPATYAISAIGVKLGGTPLVLTYAGKTVGIGATTEGVTLGPTAKKLLDFMLLLLTKYNGNKGGWTNGEPRFMLEDYMRAMGYENNRKTRGRCYDMICKDIAKLAGIKLRQDSGPWFRLLDGKLVTDQQIKKAITAGKEYLEVHFSDEFMAHLRESPRIVPFLFELFQWVGQNENAYALAKRMILHRNINKRTKNTANDWLKLKVQTLLGACPISPDQHPGNMRRTLEKTLNFLAAPSGGYGPLLDWHYLKDGKPCKPKDITDLQLSHEAWLNLTVEYILKEPYDQTGYADRSDLDVAYREFQNGENEKRTDGANIMRKKKTDPELHTPNPFLQQQQGAVSGSMPELMMRRLESLVCEQILLIRKAPPRFIKDLRDADGYLLLQDLDLPMTLYLYRVKKLSWPDCKEKPIRRLIPDDMADEECALAVAGWAGGYGEYAQIGIFKCPEGVQLDCKAGTLIKREHEVHVYYVGRLFDLLTAMSAAGLLPPWKDATEQDASNELTPADRNDWDSQDDQEGQDVRHEPREPISATPTVMSKPRLSQCEHNIFWNTYAQECAFLGMSPNVPKYVQATCGHLAAKYPDQEDAEMFIRSQFVMKVESMDYTIPTVALNFKDLVNPRHDDAFRQYQRDGKERVAMMFESALRELRKMYTLSFEAMTPLAQFVRGGADCCKQIQDVVVIHCLHWPALAQKLQLTEYIEDRIRFFKEEIRQP